jgi:hypothetical protein
MNPIIKIFIENDIITISDTPVNFELEELPYGGVGYMVNGSSKAKTAELEKYWNFVDDVFSKLNIDNSKYITLKSIQTQDNFYGIL